MFPQDRNFACFVSLLIKLCWPAVPKPDLLGHCSVESYLSPKPPSTDYDLGEGSSTIIICTDYCNSRKKKLFTTIASQKNTVNSRYQWLNPEKA